MKGWTGLLAGMLLVGSGLVPMQAQTTTAAKHKPAAKPVMAVWSQDVMRTFGVLPSKFADSGLSKLTQDQLNALMANAKPKGTTIACPVPAAGTVRVLLSVSGEDATGAIVKEITQAMSAVSGVTMVDSPAQADKTLRVVVQTLTINQKTIGYTVAYVVGTPCSETAADKKTDDVELKGVLGSTMNSKIPGLAQDLATAVGKELRAGAVQ